MSTSSGSSDLRTRISGGGKRWVRVRPAGSTGAGILLARAVSEEQITRVGNQTGGRVFIFLETDQFWRDYRNLVARSVTFVRPPTKEPGVDRHATLYAYASTNGTCGGMADSYDSAVCVPARSNGAAVIGPPGDANIRTGCRNSRLCPDVPRGPRAIADATGLFRLRPEIATNWPRHARCFRLLP
jgi:hypothetical protein